jgi:peptide/nickel transport system permease protein
MDREAAGGGTGQAELSYILKRVIQFIVFMAVLAVIVFVLARLAPGDPLVAYYGEAVEHMSTEQKRLAMERLALDRPIAEQFLRWAGSAFQGDFGISYIYKQPVTDVVAKLCGNTLLLGGISYVVTFAGSILLGIFCAAREGSRTDAFIVRAGTVSSLIPTFFVALLSILLFAVNLHVLPSSGAYSIGMRDDWADRALHLILPVFVMTVSHLWYYAYMIRNKVIDELHKDYVSLLRIKKISYRRILYRHCLKNILPSLITIMAISVPHIIAGTYIVELVFGYPGLGTLAFESARYKDYNMLSVVTLLTGSVVVASGIIGQEISAALDPAMRHEEAVHDEA